MAKKQNQTDHTEEQMVAVEQVLTKSEQFIENNSKKLSTVITVVLAIVAAYFGYSKFVVEPNSKEAASEMFVAEQQFEAGNYAAALNGDGQNLGFIEIVETYGSTPSGNLSKYYAGISQLRLGKYAEAIEYLDGFSSSDEMIEPIAKGAIGDAFAELNQAEDALDYYTTAYKMRDNKFTTPIYMTRAALMSEKLGDYAKAVSIYTELRERYPNTNEGRDAEKLLARASSYAK
jgi:tetratricopeptide (TPR) repeat protein